MKIIVIGHGQHDETEKVQVPAGVQLDFFTRPDTPMLMTNVLALLRAGDLGIPLEGAAGGEEIPNYLYDPYVDDERARAMQLDDVDPADATVYLVPEPMKLCADLGNCLPAGPHTCDGVFGVAHQFGFSHLQLLACRSNTKDLREPTHELMNEHGEPDTTVDDQLTVWTQSFLSLTPADQDAAWEDLDPETRVLVASDGEITDWARCYETRLAMAAMTPDEAAALVATLDTPVKTRLFRDHPEHRYLLAADVGLTDEENAWIEHFLGRTFAEQYDLWHEQLEDEHRVRYLAHDGIAEWTAALRVWDYSDVMHAEFLTDLIGRLSQANRARLLATEQIRERLGAYLSRLE